MLHNGDVRGNINQETATVSRHRARHLAPLLVALCLLSTTAIAPQASLLSETTGLLSGALSVVTRVVSGTLGAVLRDNNWTVQIPAGAFSGTATVTMTTGSDPTICQFEISPSTKNAFLKPATLIARVPTDVDLSDAHIEWFNPRTEAWEAVPGSTVNPLLHTVSAPVWHFSTYRVDGRSGW